jgi:Rrf2 family nitric oxide-sensitive transcriptional repressor
MQLTQHTDYGLRLLVYLALHPRRTIPAAEIAQAFNVSQNHLLKVVGKLANQRIINTHRGKNGGVTLRQRPADIGIGEVVRLLEGGKPIVNCTQPRCPVAPVCRLKTALDKAIEAFLDVLDDYTLEQLVQRQESELRAFLPLNFSMEPR